MGMKINNRDEMKDLAQKAIRALERSFKYIAFELEGNLKQNSPVDHGRLSGSWKANQAGQLNWIVGTAVKYARYQNEGTGLFGPKRRRIQSKKPGRIIRPKQARALVFKVNGETVFARQVRQPRKPLAFKIGKGKAKTQVFAMSVKGVKGKRYVEKSIAETESRIEDIVETALREAGLK